MTTGVATAEQATRAPLIGSFRIVERLTVTDAPKGQVRLRVVGAEGTPFAGQAGLATCVTAPADEAARTSTRALLDKLAALRHPTLVPVLEAGVAGNVVYWVRADDEAQGLPPRSPQNPVPIATVVAIVKAVAGGLTVAHDVGLSHGSLTHTSILSPSPGTYVVEGIGPMGRGAAQDQRDLGMIVVELLAGRPWQDETPSEPVTIEQRVARAQRLREWMSGTTERVVNIVLRATELNPADRFSSLQEFAEQFGIAVRDSADDLVHGAFEAISSRNVELARLLAAKAAQYNPSADSLTLLNLQLGGGSPFGAVPVMPPTQHVAAPAYPGFPPPPVLPEQPVAAPLQPGFPPPAPVPPEMIVPPMTAPGQSQSLLTPELAQGLPPEFLQLVAPQFEVTPRKKGMNPLFVLVMGGVGILLLMLIAAMVTLILT